MEAIQMVHEALTTLISGDTDGASQLFAKDCTFFLPIGPYKIVSFDGITQMSSIGIAQRKNVQFGETNQSRIGRTSLVTTTWVSYPSPDAEDTLTGFCTAVITEGKITHIHLSRHI